MLHHLKVFFEDLTYIFSKNRGLKTPWKLLGYHLRIKIKQIVFRIVGWRLRREKIFGMTIEFPEYGWFYYLLREIFIRENYYFPCNKIPKIIDAANFIYMATGTGVASFEFFCPEGFARNYDKCNE